MKKATIDQTVARAVKAIQKLDKTITQVRERVYVLGRKHDDLTRNKANIEFRCITAVTDLRSGDVITDKDKRLYAIRHIHILGKNLVFDCMRIRQKCRHEKEKGSSIKKGVVIPVVMEDSTRLQLNNITSYIGSLTHPDMSLGYVNKLACAIYLKKMRRE